MKNRVFGWWILKEEEEAEEFRGTTGAGTFNTNMEVCIVGIVLLLICRWDRGGFALRKGEREREGEREKAEVYELKPAFFF